MKVPARFERVAEAFQEGGRALSRLCESSGSEHSPENSMDLSELVKSFIERGIHRSDDQIDFHDEAGFVKQEKEEQHDLEPDEITKWSSLKTKDALKNLFVSKENMAETETIQAAAIQLFDVNSSFLPGFKRVLMTRLREQGFDAGLCKSKWEKSGRFPSGNYEYIDINFNDNRYIIEPFLAREFEIARPTDQYASLLEIFPPIFIGKVEELQGVVKLMSRAVKESMRSGGMILPPWRRNGYMQAKWLGSSYKRTTNEISSKKIMDAGGSAAKRSVGFVEALPKTTTVHDCRRDFGRNGNSRVGNLSAVFGVMGIES